MTMIAVTANAKEVSSADLKEVFKKPLILGASVSGDYLTESPGKRLALRYTPEKQIQVIAKKGTAGRELLKNVNASAFRDRSSIIAVDLFFWDSFSSDSKESIKAMDRLMKIASQLNIPIVVGEVPALMPSRQPAALSINKKMKEACHLYDQCKILPLDAILRKVIMDGHIVQDGTTYTLEKLLPDGLHISRPASEYLADQIIKLF